MKTVEEIKEALAKAIRDAEAIGWCISSIDVTTIFVPKQEKRKVLLDIKSCMESSGAEDA